MHTSHVYGGSDDDDQRFRRLAPPDNEMPAPVDLQVELVRTGDLALFLLGEAAYSTGVRLRLVARVRPGALDPEDPRLRGGFMVHTDVLVGFELPDGTAVSNADGGPWDAMEDDAAPGTPLLVSMGGGSDLTAFEQEIWLTPVPPPGTLRCVVSHPEMGIPETQVELDATPIAEASSRAVVLWPWEATPDHGPMGQQRDLEPGGWFDRHRPARSEHDDA